MELLSHLLGLITQQRQASLYGLAGLRETRVQEGLVLGHLQHTCQHTCQHQDPRHLQHRDLGLAHGLLLDLGRGLVLRDRGLQHRDLPRQLLYLGLHRRRGDSGVDM